MNSLIESLGALVTPDIAKKVAKHLGVDAGMVEKGAKILGALAVGNLARKAAHPSGASAAFQALPQREQPGLLSSLLTALKGDMPDETASDRMHAMFGGGANSMVSALSKKLGFNVGPLAAMLAPLVGQHLAKAVKQKSLDAGGFGKMLQDGFKAFREDPAHAESAALVDAALDVGDQAEHLRARFTPHELEEVHIAPMAACAFIAKASPSGLSGSLAEFKAANRVSMELLKDASPISLLGSLFGGGLSSAEAAELKREAQGDGQELLRTIHESAEIVKTKAPAEMDTFRRLVNDVARNVAEATKEGGFLGFGGRQVSDKEQAAMERIAAAVA
ncbi:DUF937 domain-containing protein [Luteolibacter marinus]|uniref:DUF937 domain-containing protein n=1 Tax=Luteolibacter marinus TaxID=2776705 RepID=UPI0018678DD5|nr:DUF937 domain-containing protein [Luteolibacter marinus]